VLLAALERSFPRPVRQRLGLRCTCRRVASSSSSTSRFAPTSSWLEPAGIEEGVSRLARLVADLADTDGEVGPDRQRFW
jgi:hypothetical protein